MVFCGVKLCFVVFYGFTFIFVVSHGAVWCQLVLRGVKLNHVLSIGVFLVSDDAVRYYMISNGVF